MSDLKSYHFDVGNSNTGPLGFCGRVKADSKEEALQLLREALPETVEVKSMEHHHRVEYLHVYVNDEAIKVEDISDPDPDEL